VPGRPATPSANTATARHQFVTVAGARFATSGVSVLISNQGRATHIHLEVTINGVSRKVTQIAFPESVNNTVYSSGIYASRGSNPTSNLSDGIFADSLSSELVTPSGSAASGYAASCQIGVSL
jgi:protocatechuate 3,4-dioxygenase beta subunit